MDMDNLMLKILTGQASPSEVQELEERLLNNPEQRNKFESLKILWENNTTDVSVPNDSFYQGLHTIKQIIHIRNLNKKRNYNLVLVLMTTLVLSIQYFVFNRESNATISRHVLRFNHVALGEVVIALEREFNVDISIPQKSKACQFTGAFYHESAYDAVRLVAESLDMQYKRINDNGFQLTGGRCLQH